MQAIGSDVERICRLCVNFEMNREICCMLLRLYWSLFTCYYLNLHFIGHLPREHGLSGRLNGSFSRRKVSITTV